MRMLSILVVVLVSIALGLAFIAMNSERVNINFFFFQLQNYPFAIGMFITLAIGVFLGMLASLGMLIPAWMGLKRLRHQKEIVELELDKLRKLPLSNE